MEKKVLEITEAPCPHCGNTIEVYKNKKGGYTGDCRKCQKVIKVSKDQVKGEKKEVI